MPPSYKPLASAGGIQGAPGLPAEIFAPPANISFQDAERANAQLLAQELANQNAQFQLQNAPLQQQNLQTQVQANQLALAEKQREEEYRNQLAIRSGPQPITTEDGRMPGEEFDPNAALALAQQLAFEGGDLSKGLAIEKATRDRNESYAPLSDEQLAVASAEFGSQLPAGTTSKFLSTIASLRGKNLYGQSLQDNRENKSNQLASLAPGGFEADINSKTGQGPTKKDGEKFTATTVAHSRIQNDLDMLEKSLQSSGGNDPSSPEFTRQKALLGDIQIALKEKNNFGAALTANEQALNSSALPQILARPDVGVTEALVSSGLGRDPVEAINTLRQMLATDFQSQAKTYKFKPTSAAENLTEGATQETGNGFKIPVTPKGTSGVPRNPDGSVLTREQFMQLRNSGGK